MDTLSPVHPKANGVQGRLMALSPSCCRFAHLSKLAIDSSLANSKQPGRFQRLAIRPLVGGHDDRPLHLSHRRKRFCLRDLAEEDRSFLFRTRSLEPFCGCGNQSVSLFELLKALRVLPNHDLLHHALNNPHDRLRQSLATTPATGSIAPLDEFATAATDFIPFLAHDVTSQVENALAQSKRLSCTLVSVAVGQIAAFFPFFEGRFGSIRWMPNGAGAGSVAIKPGRSGARSDSSSDSGSTAVGRGSTFSRSWPRSRHTASADSPTPAFSTSSRAIALIRSSSVSSACRPSPENLPSIMSATSIFLPIRRRQVSCIVPE